MEAEEALYDTVRDYNWAARVISDVLRQLWPSRLTVAPRPPQVELDDMEYDPDEEAWLYPCPCGDYFTIYRVIALIFPLYHYLICDDPPSRRT